MKESKVNTCRTQPISQNRIALAERCLVQNGIDADEASTVLQALGYILMDEELYPDNEK